MSVKQTSELWKRECEAKRKHLLHAICDCADDDGRAFPSVNYLVWKTDLPRSTVVFYLKEFRAKGVIEDAGRRSTIEQSVTKNSERDTAVIWVRLEKLPPKILWRKPKEVCQPLAQGMPATGTGVCQLEAGGMPAGGNAIRKNHNETSLKPNSYSKLADRNERDRRAQMIEATQRGLRDFSKHPRESWETA